MNIRPVEAEWFHANRHDEANSCFCNFVNAPKNEGTIINVPYTHTHTREVGAQLSLC